MPVRHDLVLFGFDGTISDPVVGIGRSLNHALLHFGYPGIPEALAALDEARVPLAVCTSKRVDFAQRILAMFGLHDYFKFVSGGDIGVQKWQQMAELLFQGKVSAATVMVGDRAVDLVAAHRNGLHAAHPPILPQLSVQWRIRNAQIRPIRIVDRGVRRGC